LDDWIRDIRESVMFVRHGDVDDGQHHEYVSLENRDESVEAYPEDLRQPAAYRAGAAMVRVHDVRETVDFLRVFSAIEQRRR